MLGAASTPPRVSGTVTIANGASLSDALDLVHRTLCAILMPASWTAAGLTFQGSADGVTYGNIYDADGEAALTSTVVGASRLLILNPAAFVGARYVKVRSGTSGTPASQGAERVLTLITREIA